MENPSLEQDREAAIDRLIMNYGHGELTHTELEQRLDRALDAADADILTGLTQDLPLEVDDQFLQRKHDTLLEEETPTTPAKQVEGDSITLPFIMGGGHHRIKGEAPERITVICFWGGGCLDLREATVNKPSITVNVFCLMGRLSILVPKGVRVKAPVVNLLGGLYHLGFQANSPEAPLLRVRGLVLMGGGTVRYRRKRRNNLIVFGQSLRRCGRIASPRP